MARVVKRGKGYNIRVSCGRDVNDKQIIKTTTWHPDPTKTEKQNQKALEAFVIEFEQNVKAGFFLDGEKTSFKDFSNRWLSDYAANQLEPTTLESHKHLLDTHNRQGHFWTK